MTRNQILIASAGSGKTGTLVEESLSRSGSVLITTYTRRNKEELTSRIAGKNRGVLPPNVTVMTWFEFLLRELIKPYQTVFVEPCWVRSVNFKTNVNEEPWRFFSKNDPQNYYFDSARDVYQDRAADLAVKIDNRSQGKSVRRLEAIWDTIFIDEFQDLVGWDLEVIDLLLGAGLELMAVGDPRQYTYSTNSGRMNNKYRGMGVLEWVTQRHEKGLLVRTSRDWSFRCNQFICDFGDRLYPDMPRTNSKQTKVTKHEGVFLVQERHVKAYTTEYSPLPLRWSRTNKRPEKLGLQAENFGEVKGGNFDRVLIFPTKPFLDYLKDGKVAKLTDTALARLYVAATRARHSAAFVVQSSKFKSPFAEMWSPEEAG